MNISTKLAFVLTLGLTTILYSQDSYEDYSRIDRHALDTPSNVESSLQSLAEYLVRPARSDKEKIRALFRWVTENIKYDVQSYLARQPKNRSAQQVLKDKNAVCGGYAKLMYRLGRLSGLEVVEVIGYSKGYDYKLSDKFRDGPNHAWNAVKVNGNWYLFDATWGAGSIDENDRFVRRFQEHYFLTPPESFLLDHLPEESRWQLVDRPISIQEFEDYLYLKPAFFGYGLSVKSHYQNTLEIYDETKIEFYIPDDVSLTAQLYQNENPLAEYFTFSQRKSGQVTTNIHVPKSGEYILRFYVKKQNNTTKYEWAGDYKIIASGGKSKFAGFPFTYSTFMDRNAYLYEPRKRYLRESQDTKFKIFIPGAKEVAIKIDEEWFSLEGRGYVYEGYIPIKKGKIQLLAKFNEGNQFNALLDYICP